jgi:Helix-turn-helix domain
MDTMATSGNNTIPQIAQPFVAKKCATVNASSPEGYSSQTDRALWDIKQVAEYLHLSESWVRRHLCELPYTRKGRLIRFDPDALHTTIQAGKSLESGRNTAMPVPRRYQQGSIVWKDTTDGKVAYGVSSRCANRKGH